MTKYEVMQHEWEQEIYHRVHKAKTKIEKDLKRERERITSEARARLIADDPELATLLEGADQAVRRIRYDLIELEHVANTGVRAWYARNQEAAAAGESPLGSQYLNMPGYKGPVDLLSINRTLDVLAERRARITWATHPALSHLLTLEREIGQIKIKVLAAIETNSVTGKRSADTYVGAFPRGALATYADYVQSIIDNAQRAVDAFLTATYDDAPEAG